ncbi:MAG: restriction endonuclease subunit S [Deltaproteobacteria bacterium HGW-Deltaproteobacteria-1]|jgi:type I restriction enzyme S subunit|nr:MAG: restriction endonuclease subunit S [Deltaproteobacteria bacterium HGW-Deltaproteobacteria-1]
MIYNDSKYNADWEEKPLNRLGEFSRGKSKHRPRNDKKLFVDGKYPFIQTGEIKAANLFINSHSEMYNDFGLKQSRLWDNNTLCITIAANIAETALLGYPMCFPDSVVGFNAYPNESSELFMHYVFTYIKKSIQNSASGSIQDNINIDYLTALNFRIPKKKYQDKIVAVLYALDSKIEFNNRINAALEAMAKTLYDFWFVQFDFPDKNGMPYKSSGGKMVWHAELKREIPEGWEVKSLNELTEVSNEQVNPIAIPDKEYKHYSIPAFDACGSYKSEKGIDILSNKFKIRKTDVLVSKLNPWFSRVIYATDESDLISSTEFVVWREKNIGKKNYLFMIARDASFVTYCTQSAAGTSNSHKRVTPKVMMKYRVVYNEQVAESFGIILGSTIKMYAKNQIETNNLSELRDWLLPMLMNGQVKVK